jgi:iron complex transport system substrate-binding protein
MTRKPNLGRSLRTLSAMPLQFVLVGLLVASCQSGESPPPSSAAPVAETATSTCPVDYDPDKDYFPNKVKVDYAVGFSVEYHPHYKVVTVKNPWQGADTTFEYVLVQCGAPIPEGYDQAQIIEVPVEKVVALSTTYLPHLDLLDRVDALVGVDQFQRVNTPSVRDKIDAGELSEFNSGTTLNVERLLVAEPDLVMTFSTGNPETDSFPRLIKAGVPVALVAEYLEETPLGQAEWLKFTALFFNQEAQAQEVFDDIAQTYEALVQKTQAITTRPTVFTGSSYNGTWYVPGGESFVAKLLADAGADYLWAETDTTGSLPLDFEAVYDRAAEADFWVNLSQDWQTQQEALVADPRYGEFAALQQGQMFNNNARINGTGGNDYLESGIVSPQVVLADLIAIFHPELLPDHELVYYQKLQP